MFKAALSFVTVIAVASLALSSPAMAKGGNSGGGSHTVSTGTTKQTSNSQSQPPKSGKVFLKYNFGLVSTTKVNWSHDE